MTTTPLDFAVRANNDIFVTLTLNNPDGTPFTDALASIKWQAFKPGTRTAVITKTKADNSITTVDQNAGQYGFWINAADTAALAAGNYPHEAVTVDGSGHAVTVTNNDTRLTGGTMTIIGQLTKQT